MPSNDRERITLNKWKEWMERRVANVLSHSVSFVGKKHKAFGSENPAFYIGLELEVDYFRISSLTKARSILLKYLGEFSFIFKHDGSIGGRRSVEMVTSPRSYMNWDDVDLESMCQELRDLGFRSWDSGNCGFHLHFSRLEGMGMGCLIDRTIAQFFVDHTKELEAFSRRNKYEYCQFKSDVDGYLHGGRYLAVNFTNDHTIEFRFPRGTLNPAPLRAYIQVCNAIYELTIEKCKEQSSRSNNVPMISWVDLQQYLLKRRKSTVEARDVLRSLNLWTLENGSDVTNELVASEKIKVLTKLNKDLPRLQRILNKSSKLYGTALNRGASSTAMRQSARRDQASRLLDDTKVELRELRNKGVEKEYVKHLIQSVLKERKNIVGGNTEHLNSLNYTEYTFVAAISPTQIEADKDIVQKTVDEMSFKYPFEKIISKRQNNGYVYVSRSNTNMPVSFVRSIGADKIVKNFDAYIEGLKAKSNSYLIDIIEDEVGNKVVWRFDNIMNTYVVRDGYGFIAVANINAASSSNLAMKYPCLRFGSHASSHVDVNTAPEKVAKDLWALYKKAVEENPKYTMRVLASLIDHGYTYEKPYFTVLGTGCPVWEKQADGIYTPRVFEPDYISSWPKLADVVRAMEQRKYEPLNLKAGEKFIYHTELDLVALKEGRLVYNLIGFKQVAANNYIGVNKVFNKWEYTDMEDVNYGSLLNKVVEETVGDIPAVSTSLAEKAFSKVIPVYAGVTLERARSRLHELVQRNDVANVTCYLSPSFEASMYNVYQIPETIGNDRAFTRVPVEQITMAAAAIDHCMRLNAESGYSVIHGYRLNDRGNRYEVYRLEPVVQQSSTANKDKAEKMSKALMDAVAVFGEQSIKQHLITPLANYCNNNRSVGIRTPVYSMENAEADAETSGDIFVDQLSGLRVALNTMNTTDLNRYRVASDVFGSTMSVAIDSVEAPYQPVEEEDYEEDFFADDDDEDEDDDS